MTMHALRLALLLLAGAAPALAQTPIRLTLDEALARAFEASHRLAEASAREAGALAVVRTRRTADQPTVSVSAGYARTNHVEEFGFRQADGSFRVIFPDIPDNYFTRLSLQWPIYTGGRVDALARAAEAEARATGAELEAARADLRLEVVRAYWALATAAESARVLQDALDRADAHLGDVRSRFAAGLIPPNEVSSAEAQRARQLLQLIEARNLRRAAVHALGRLTGVDGEIELADALDSATVAETPLPPGAAAAAVAERSEHRALVDRLRAAAERRESIEAGRRPTLSVTGLVDYANPNPRIFPRRDVWRDSWELAVSVQWNLWDGGRIAAESAEAAAAEAALRARLAETDSLMSLEIRQRLLDRDSARAALVAAAEGVASAADARRVVGERFGVGVATSTDVLDAQVALLQAELDRTRALANLRLADASLERALGK